MDNDNAGPRLEPVIKKVMLVVDGSLASEQAAQFAYRFAAQLQCALEAVFVIDTATMDYLVQMRIFVSDERRDLEGALEEKGHNYLDRTHLLGKAFGLDIETTILRGRFHDTVIRHARTSHADAIIIGGWRRTSHDKDTFSVERELVMQFAECPVFVVKAKS